MLHDHSNLLQKINVTEALSWYPSGVSPDPRKGTTPLAQKLPLNPHHWHEMVAAFKVGVLGLFIPLCLLRHCSSFPCSEVGVYCAILSGQVASHTSTFPPLHGTMKGSIWAFAIRTIEACGFQMAGDPHSTKRPLDELMAAL